MRNKIIFFILVGVCLYLIWFLWKKWRGNKNGKSNGCRGNFTEAGCTNPSFPIAQTIPNNKYTNDYCADAHFSAVASEVYEFGDEGCMILHLQQRLNVNLYEKKCAGVVPPPNIAADGMFGCETLGALKFITGKDRITQGEINNL